jgi:putative lipoprotein
MRVEILPCLLLLACLVSCAAKAPDIRLDPAKAEPLAYDCPDGYRFDALVCGEAARLFLPERTADLQLVRAASGARYEGGGVLYWSKGDQALLEAGGETHRGCRVVGRKSPWAEAALEGVVFRAVGQEPGWLADLHADGGIEVLVDYGREKFTFPDSRSVVKDGDTVYTARHDRRELRLRVRPKECFDIMSGFEFPAEVEMELDGRSLKGCGRPLR